MRDFFSFYKLIIIAIILVIVVGMSVAKTIRLHKNEELINSNPAYTIGEITKYYEIGISNYHLEYKYDAEGGTYTNEVSPDVLFKNCEDDSNCINRKIYVKYYKGDHSISIPILDSIP